ncbi:1-phosphatidylinositol-3-phosphate 5-kinase FAB1B [Glycine soja]
MRFFSSCLRVAAVSSTLDTFSHAAAIDGENAYLVMLVLDCGDAVHDSGSRRSLRFRFGRFFRERSLRFVKINVDVFAEREKELRKRIGSAMVPKIFFGERLIGGLVELNAPRKDDSGELERRLAAAVGEGPSAPTYGFDEAAEVEEAAMTEEEEEIGRVVRVLRQRLPIQDQLMKMKIARNCFVGIELVELLVRHHGCAPSKSNFFVFLFLLLFYVYSSDREAVLFYDDENEGTTGGGEWGYLRSFTSFDSGECRSRDKTSEDHRKAMKTVVEGHYRALVA